MTDSERRALATHLFGTGKDGDPPGPIHPGWAQRNLTGTRTTLARWRKNGIPPDRLEDVLDAIRDLIMDIEEEAPRPAWAEGLEDRITDALVRRLGESPGAALEAELVRLGLLPAEPRNGEAPAHQDDERTGQQPSRKPA